MPFMTVNVTINFLRLYCINYIEKCLDKIFIYALNTIFKQLTLNLKLKIGYSFTKPRRK